MKIQRIFYFCVFCIAIQGAGLLANSATLDPRFVTQSGADIIITNVEPFPFDLVQLVGHRFKQPEERYFSGVDLGLVQSTSKHIESAISLLSDNLALGYEINNQGKFSAAISSLTDPKKISIIELSPQVWDNSSSAKSIKFEKFVSFRALFFEKVIAFYGQQGMESMVRIIDRALSSDMGLVVGARQLVRDDLPVAGLDSIYKIDEETMLVAASLHSTEENVFKQNKALLILSLEGKTQKEYHFVATSYDVYANKNFITLAAITGEPGLFELEVQNLNKNLKVSKSFSIPINKFFPAQYKFIDAGERPLLAVLNVESVDIIDTDNGLKLLSFKSKHEITDLVEFVSIDGRLFLFVMLKDQPGNTVRAAYFELPSI